MAAPARSKKGSFAELGAAMIVVIPLVLTTIDLAVIAIAAGINDAVCRDAARAAASGPPAAAAPLSDHLVAQGAPPYERAEAVIKRVYITSVPAKVRDAVQINESIADLPPEPEGGAVDGQVTVKTTMDVYPLFLVRAIVPNGVALAASHTVPYTYVIPSGP